MSNVEASMSIATSLVLPISIPLAPSNANTPEASISIPPAVALISIALVPVPAEFTDNIWAPPPTAAKVKFLASPVTVILELSVPSIDTVVESRVKPAEVSISNVEASISIATSLVLPISIPLAPSKANTPEASISIPPAVALISIALAPVPAEFTDNTWVLPPAAAKVRFLPEPATVILESSVVSIDILVLSMSIPPAVALISIALAPVPAEFTDNTCVLPPATAKVRFLPEPVTVKLELSVPSIEIVVASSVKPDEVSISNVEASISIATSLVLPISIPLALSNDNTPEASISIPPAVALISIALAPVPAEFTDNTWVLPPAAAKVRFLPEPVTVILELSVPSIDTVVASRVKPAEVSISNVEASISMATSLVLPISIPLAPSNANTPEASISIPPAVALISIALVPVPAEFTANTWVLPPAAVNVRFLPEPVTVKLELSVPSIEIVVASSVKPAEVSISNVEASISIATSLVLPISIPLAPSKANTPEASISIPPAVALISMALVPVPAEFTDNTWVPPPATANVRSLPELVTVTLESSVPSIDIVVASSVKPVVELISIPPVVVESFKASAPVPVELNIKLESTFPVNPIVKSWPLALDANVIFDELEYASILNALASILTALFPPPDDPNCNTPVPWGSIEILELLPEVIIFITPEDVISIILAEVISIPPAVLLTCKASAPVPVELNIKLEFVAPVIPIVKSSASPSVANVILDALPKASILNDCASKVIAVLLKLPNANVPVPWGLIVILELLPEVVIFIVPPDVISITEEDVISIPPVLAVICKASDAVPVELNIKLALTPAASIAIVKSPSVVAVCDILLAPPALSIVNGPLALISIPVEVIIILFPAAIVKSAPLPKIYSLGLPYWICFPEVNNKPSPGACVNDTSLVVPNDNIVLSFCNLILLRTIPSWFEFNTFVFT